MRTRIIALSVLAAVALPSASISAAASPVIDIAAVPPTPTVADTLASGLSTPWGLAFLPDGSALISERDSAKVKRITPDGDVSEVGTVANVVPGGEGGLLGLAVAPTFAEDRFLYAYYTASGDNRIVRMRYDDNGLGTQEVLVTGMPKASIHNGGRLAFGPDGMLYAGTGDAGNSADSQNPNSLGGKILRVTPTGQPAPGNPSGTRVWTLGHRNVQGLTWDPEGRMWASELGQNTWDELNRIEAGKNYGWPTCEGTCSDTRFVNPKATWPTSEASPSGLTYAQNTLWMCSLRGERLWAIPIGGGELDGDPQAFFVNEHGRLRAIAPAPDGSLWLATNTGSNVLKLTLSSQ